MKNNSQVKKKSWTQGFKSFVSWVSSMLGDGQGEASSKRFAMLLLVFCLGAGFIASMAHKYSPENHITDAVVTVILFLAGYTSVDTATKVYGNIKSDSKSAKKAQEDVEHLEHDLHNETKD